jgi:hypothetical protein
MDSDDEILEGAAELLQHVHPEDEEEEEDESPQSARVLARNGTYANHKSGQTGRMENGSSGHQRIQVLVSPPARPWEYESFPEDTTVDHVVKKLPTKQGGTEYEIAFLDGRTEEVSLQLHIISSTVKQKTLKVTFRLTPRSYTSYLEFVLPAHLSSSSLLVSFRSIAWLCFRAPL